MISKTEVLLIERIEKIKNHHTSLGIFCKSRGCINEVDEYGTSCLDHYDIPNTRSTQTTSILIHIETQTTPPPPKRSLIIVPGAPRKKKKSVMDKIRSN